ncbi:MAG: DMT family transporter [Clostridiales Family XIII bacterium]|jgi:drug/metabolite transporter (DMT)-like permease|nr:DMT family transporter [Clostridiales Family XIII bacterium]
MKQQRFFWVAVIMINCFFAGTGPAVTQKAFALQYSIESVLCSRFLIAACCIWLYVLISAADVRVTKRELLYALGIGVFFTVGAVFMNESYRYLPGAISSILVFLYIVIVNVFEIVRKTVSKTPMRYFCLALSMAGLAMVVWKPGEGLQFNAFGVLLALGAGLMYAFHALAMGSKVLENISAIAITAYAAIPTAVFSLLRCLAANQPILPAAVPAQWVCVLFLGIGTSFAGPICYCLGIKRLGVSDASITNTGEPVFAYFAGIAIMGDIISANALFGGILIVCSILLLNLIGRGRQCDTVCV